MDAPINNITPETQQPVPPVEGLKTANSSLIKKARNIPIYKNVKIDAVFILGLIIGFIAIAFLYSYFTSEDTPFVSPFSRGGGKSGGGASVFVRNVEHPLTGIQYSEDEAEAWRNVRPLAVMVNNHVDARPQSGLVDADVVYEIVAEGGITRFLAFFSTEIPDKIGPVRSTRHYYLVLVKEMGDAMLMHIGWSPQALEAIETWPVRSLGRGGGQFWRDQDRLNAGVATEHTAYVSGVDLLEVGMNLGWEGTTEEFTSWKFKSDTPISSILENDGSEVLTVGEQKPITVSFWFEGDYSAIWNYDESTNSYLRSMGYDTEGNPIPHKDQETGEQISIKNLIIQFATESSIAGDAKNRLDYELIGSGEGLVFIDGLVKQVTWTKEERDSRTMFYDEQGQEVEFNRGKFWISIVPDNNRDKVVY